MGIPLSLVQINDFILYFEMIFIIYVVCYLRNKTCFPCLHSLVKLRRKFRGIQEQISENPRRCQGFSPAREFSQTLLRFSTGYGGTEAMFYFFYKIIIFIVNKEKGYIRSSYCKFSYLGDSQTTLLKPFLCFIVL